MNPDMCICVYVNVLNSSLATPFKKTRGKAEFEAVLSSLNCLTLFSLGVVATLERSMHYAGTGITCKRSCMCCSREGKRESTHDYEEL
ncbi:hypothetical protein PM082_020563 [Marasmius tenuissimus]|nr:hypothetical protein PM082_020563 [Marasmius tenuissimus]